MKKFRTRLLSAILTLAMLLPLAPSALAAGSVPASEPPGRSSQTSATGAISVTVRIDYPQTTAAMSGKNIELTLADAQGLVCSFYLLNGELSSAGEHTRGGVTWTTKVRSDGQWAAYLDATVSGLPTGHYAVSFKGVGYRDFTVENVDLTTYNQHITVGTGDGTFTLGDVNGDEYVNDLDKAALSEHLGSTDPGDLAAYDLNGDGRIDVVDLAYVVRMSGLRDEVVVPQSTSLIAPPVNTEALQAEIASTGTKAEGDVASLFTASPSAGPASPVKLAPAANEGPDGGAEITPENPVRLPITLETAVEMEEIDITTPAGAGSIRDGSVTVTLENGTEETIPFNSYTVPSYVHAIGNESGGSGVIKVNLGKRIPVKKVTITVTQTESGGFAAMESIQFLQDIVEENPQPANKAVRGLTAEAAENSVTLKWTALPNIGGSGYTVRYWVKDQISERKELTVMSPKATIDNLEEETDYVFAVFLPGFESQAAQVEVHTAKQGVPGKIDYLTPTAGNGSVGLTWRAAKGAVSYELWYRAVGESGWTLASGIIRETRYTVTGLQNGTEYEFYAVPVNNAGRGPATPTVKATPEAVEYKRPDGIPTEGVLDYSVIERIVLENPNSYSPTQHPNGFNPAVMYDGDFSTAWTSMSYNDGQWWASKKIIVTFQEPQDISAIFWVPRLDGNYSGNLRVYSVTVWTEDDVNAQNSGTLAAPDPNRGNGGQQTTWVPVKNSPAVTKFGVLPITPAKGVKQMAITIEPTGYNAISLSELLFLRYDPSKNVPELIDALFTDELKTALKAGVSEADIAAIESDLNANQNYYMDVDTLRDELSMARDYLAGRSTTGVVVNGIQSRSNGADSSAFQQSGSDLQPLGVAAKAGTEITVYATGIPAGESVTVYATQYNAEVVAWRQEMGTLTSGRNILKVPQIGSQSTLRGGSLYITYSGANAANIRLHVRRAIDMPVLELSGWYDMAEDARKAAIRDYIAELEEYVKPYAGVEQTDCRNVTEISTPVVLLSIPATQVWAVLKNEPGSEARVQILYQNVLAWEQLMHLCQYTQGIIDTDPAVYAPPVMQSRQNVRCMQMFAGAFMYAAGNHIGIGFDSCSGVACGKPVTAGQVTAETGNGLFGWGIAHEVGHNMDKLGKAEITNNIYAILAQTYDGADNTVIDSRLAVSEKYPALFTKVAQRQPGASNDVFVQLGMYWQLHLAYDGAGDSSLAFFHNFFKAWKAGTYTAGLGGLSYDEKVALTAAGVAGKNLTEFFSRWGMTLGEAVKAKLAEYAKEDRAIWYLSDESRRERLAGTPSAAGTVSVTARAVQTEDSYGVELTITPSMNGTVQGYEILRDGKSVGFATGTTFVDDIGSANHLSFSYTVAAYDILGNKICEGTSNEVRIAHDMLVPASEYTETRDGTTVTFDLTHPDGYPVSGVKFGKTPDQGTFKVTVTTGAGEAVAREAEFNPENNQAVDDPTSFLTYFRKPGGGTEDTRICTYDAKKVVVEGVPEDVTVALISYAGDDVSFLSPVSIGTLKSDYTYEVGDGSRETIPAGTLVIMGTYRSDPTWAYIKIKGIFTSTEADGTVGVPVERYMDGYTLLLANEQEDGQYTDISDGIFIFVPNVQREAELQKSDKDKTVTWSDCGGENILPSKLRVELWRSASDPYVTSAADTMTANTYWINSPGGDELPQIELTTEVSH